MSDLSVELPLKKSIGFVGSSGAGKTTFMDLLLGLLSPDQGRICYGDSDIRDYPDAWGHKLGYIPQSIYLADDTIRRMLDGGTDCLTITVDAHEKVNLGESLYVRRLHQILGLSEKGGV